MAWVQLHQAVNSKTQKMMTVAGKPNSSGATDANTTPINPSPSRQPTTLLRMDSSPPSMAPHDWWATLSPL